MRPDHSLFILLLAAATLCCNNQQTSETANEAVDTTARAMKKPEPIPAAVTQAESQSPVVAQKKIAKTKPVIKQEQENSYTYTDNEVTETKNPIPEKDTIPVSLSEIFKQVEKTPQVFTLNPQRDTTLICKEGTVINIPAKCFMTENPKRDVRNNVQVSVTEYYKMSDILLANLSTTSGDEILETGGMINITATSNNANCVLKKGERIQIRFPTENRKDSMKLFTGIWKTESQVDWQASERELVYTNVPFICILTESTPRFPGGQKEMNRFISKNTLYPGAAKEKRVGGTVFLEFTITTKGKIKNIKVVKGTAPELDSAAVDVIRKMPDWVPASINDSTISVQYRIAINFILSERNASVRSYNGMLDWEGVSGKSNFVDYDSDSSIAAAGTDNLSYYLLSSTQLGWINCDRFWNEKPQTNYIVSGENISKGMVKIIFHKFDGIVDGRQQGKNFVFGKVPAGAEITIVAITYKDNKPFLCIKDTRIDKSGEKNLLFEQPLTAELLKEEMKKLDRF